MSEALRGSGLRRAVRGLVAGSLLAWVPAAAAGESQAPRAPVRRPFWEPRLEVHVQTVPGVRATFDLEIRNASEEDVDLPIVATLWLRPPVQPDGSLPPESSALSARLDPMSGAGADPSAGPVDLRLPVRGATRVRLRLDDLGWSLSPPLYVWVPRPLSHVADYPEYDLSLHVMAMGFPPERTESKPVRVRLGSR